MKAKKRGKIVVISDTHFGDETQLLDDARTVDRLMEALADRGPIAELILLGDILDLWVETLMPTLRKARYFIESLSRLTNVACAVYVPGNHDHQMFMDAFRLEQDVRIMQGDLSTARFMPARSYGETLLNGLAAPRGKFHISMTYPYLVRSLDGGEVVLAHGHHLDFYARTHGWARTFWLGRHIIGKRRHKSVTLHDIEMANIPFCGAMSAAPWVPELVDEGLRYYRVISFFGRLFSSETLRESPLRDSLIKENYEEIEQLLPQFGKPEPLCFVYGHTHRPGLGRLPGRSTVIVNCGSWTRQKEETMPTRTWVEIDGDVKLFELGREGPVMLNREDLQVLCHSPDDG